MKTVALILGASLTCAGQCRAPDQKVFSFSENMTLYGPVKTVRSETQELAKDPRKVQRLTPNLEIQYTELDQRGVRKSELWNSNGTQFEVAHLDPSTDDCTETWRSDKSGEVRRNVYRKISVNQFETLSISGIGITRVVEQYDSQKRLTHSWVYTRSSVEPAEKEKLLSDVTNIYPDENSSRWVVREGDGRLNIDQEDRWDDDGNIISRNLYDENGKLVMTFSLDRHGNLTSWWHDPTSKRRGSLGVVETAEGVTRSYEVTETGQLERMTEIHPGRRGNLYPDEMVRTTESGRLLEKVKIKYEKDSHGNWTKAIVSVWNPKTNEMVNVRQVSRIFEYY